MGDTMDKQCFQNPFDVVEGVTHAGQAAIRHTDTLTYLTVIKTLPDGSLLHLALTHCQHSNKLHDCLSCRGSILANPGIV